MAVRLLLMLAAVLCVGALAACSGSGQDAEDDDPTADLSAEQRSLLAAGPNPACGPEASREDRERFVEANADLNDKQLAWVCPALYPSDYLSDEERQDLQALGEDRDSSPQPAPRSQDGEGGTSTSGD